MSLSILNSVSSLVAENSLNQTSASQQKTLQQLSTGLKINSSADDAAGLDIATGLQANISALAQSYANANNGVSFLQVADGALSQVNSLLNRAVVLATESASSNLTGQQRIATNTEYQSILAEIGQIGAATEFNGTQVFSDGLTSQVNLTATGGGGGITATIDPADTLSGGFTVTSTIPGDAGTSSPVTLTDNGGTSTSGTIDPTATLSGSITVTSTIPGTSSNLTDVLFSSAGNMIQGMVNPPDTTLNGSLSVTSVIPAHTGTPTGVTFTASGTGASEAITSSVITTGATLSGTLVIFSSIGSLNSNDSIDLSQYQGLSSSDPNTATAAANQFAADLTANLGSITGSTYSASISGGILKIQTSDSVPSPVSLTLTASGNTLTSAPLVTGDVLSGTFIVDTSRGGLLNNWKASDFQGLTSSDPATVAAALSFLENSLNTSLLVGGTTGSTYTATINGSHQLVITSSNPAETWSVDADSATETGVAETLLVGGVTNVTQAVPIAEVDTQTNVSLNNVTAANLQSALQSRLGSNYSVSYNETFGSLEILISDQGLSAGINSIALDSSTLQEGSPGVPAQNVPTVINLAGQTKTTLQSYLQSKLPDYTVSYDQSSGALAISLNSNNSDGYTSFSTSNSATQTVGYVAPINAATTVSLGGLTKTNLSSSLLTQLGSGYTVNYDQSSGVLNIGISTAGQDAGITTIASSSSSAQQTAPLGTVGLTTTNVFTSDGTANDGTNLDVTVGSLTTANLGTANGSAGVDLSTSNLSSATNAVVALSLITAAIDGIANQRGAVGANINRLTATANDIGTEQINLTSASNSILNADIGKTVVNMTQYNILQSTGMASLQQANQAQQAVLKLLQ